MGKGLMWLLADGALVFLPHTPNVQIINAKKNICIIFCGKLPLTAL